MANMLNMLPRSTMTRDDERFVYNILNPLLFEKNVIQKDLYKKLSVDYSVDLLSTALTQIPSSTDISTCEIQRIVGTNKSNVVLESLPDNIFESIEKFDKYLKNTNYRILMFFFKHYFATLSNITYLTEVTKNSQSNYEKETNASKKKVLKITYNNFNNTLMKEQKLYDEFQIIFEILKGYSGSSIAQLTDQIFTEIARKYKIKSFDHSIILDKMALTEMKNTYKIKFGDLFDETKITKSVYASNNQIVETIDYATKNYVEQLAVIAEELVTIYDSYNSYLAAIGGVGSAKYALKRKEEKVVLNNSEILTFDHKSENCTYFINVEQNFLDLYFFIPDVDNLIFIEKTAELVINNTKYNKAIYTRQGDVISGYDMHTYFDDAGMYVKIRIPNFLKKDNSGKFINHLLSMISFKVKVFHGTKAVINFREHNRLLSTFFLENFNFYRKDKEGIFQKYQMVHNLTVGLEEIDSKFFRYYDISSANDIIQQNLSEFGEMTVLYLEMDYMYDLYFFNDIFLNPKCDIVIKYDLLTPYVLIENFDDSGVFFRLHRKVTNDVKLDNSARRIVKDSLNLEYEELFYELESGILFMDEFNEPIFDSSLKERVDYQEQFVGLAEYDIKNRYDSFDKVEFVKSFNDPKAISIDMNNGILFTSNRETGDMRSVDLKNTPILSLDTFGNMIVNGHQSCGMIIESTKVLVQDNTDKKFYAVDSYEIEPIGYSQNNKDGIFYDINTFEHILQYQGKFYNIDLKFGTDEQALKRVDDLVYVDKISGQCKIKINDEIISLDLFSNINKRIRKSSYSIDIRLDLTKSIVSIYAMSYSQNISTTLILNCMEIQHYVSKDRKYGLTINSFFYSGNSYTNGDNRSIFGRQNMLNSMEMLENVYDTFEKGMDITKQRDELLAETFDKNISRLSNFGVQPIDYLKNSMRTDSFKGVEKYIKNSLKSISDDVVFSPIYLTLRNKYISEWLKVSSYNNNAIVAPTLRRLVADYLEKIKIVKSTDNMIDVDSMMQFRTVVNNSDEILIANIESLFKKNELIESFNDYLTYDIWATNNINFMRNVINRSYYEDRKQNIINLNPSTRKDDLKRLFSEFMNVIFDDNVAQVEASNIYSFLFISDMTLNDLYTRLDNTFSKLTITDCDLILKLSKSYSIPITFSNELETILGKIRFNNELSNTIKKTFTVMEYKIVMYRLFYWYISQNTFKESVLVNGEFVETEMIMMYGTKVTVDTLVDKIKYKPFKSTTAIYNHESYNIARETSQYSADKRFMYDILDISPYLNYNADCNLLAVAVRPTIDDYIYSLRDFRFYDYGLVLNSIFETDDFYNEYIINKKMIQQHTDAIRVVLDILLTLASKYNYDFLSINAVVVKWFVQRTIKDFVKAAVTKDDIFVIIEKELLTVFGIPNDIVEYKLIEESHTLGSLGDNIDTIYSSLISMNYISNYDIVLNVSDPIILQKYDNIKTPIEYYFDFLFYIGRYDLVLATLANYTEDILVTSMMDVLVYLDLKDFKGDNDYAKYENYITSVFSEFLPLHSTIDNLVFIMKIMEASNSSTGKQIDSTITESLLTTILSEFKERIKVRSQDIIDYSSLKTQIFIPSKGMRMQGNYDEYVYGYDRSFKEDMGYDLIPFGASGFGDTGLSVDKDGWKEYNKESYTPHYYGKFWGNEIPENEMEQIVTTYIDEYYQMKVNTNTEIDSSLVSFDDTFILDIVADDLSMLSTKLTDFSYLTVELDFNIHKKYLDEYGYEELGFGEVPEEDENSFYADVKERIYQDISQLFYEKLKVGVVEKFYSDIKIVDKTSPIPGYEYFAYGEGVFGYDSYSTDQVVDSKIYDTLSNLSIHDRNDRFAVCLDDSKVLQQKIFFDNLVTFTDVSATDEIMFDIKSFMPIFMGYEFEGSMYRNKHEFDMYLQSNKFALHDVSIIQTSFSENFSMKIDFNFRRGIPGDPYSDILTKFMNTHDTNKAVVSEILSMNIEFILKDTLYVYNVDSFTVEALASIDRKSIYGESEHIECCFIDNIIRTDILYNFNDKLEVVDVFAKTENPDMINLLTKENAISGERDNLYKVSLFEQYAVNLSSRVSGDKISFTISDYLKTIIIDEEFASEIRLFEQKIDVTVGDWLKNKYNFAEKVDLILTGTLEIISEDKFGDSIEFDINDYIDYGFTWNYDTKLDVRATDKFIEVYENDIYKDDIHCFNSDTVATGLKQMSVDCAGIGRVERFDIKAFANYEDLLKVQLKPILSQRINEHMTDFIQVGMIDYMQLMIDIEYREKVNVLLSEYFSISGEEFKILNSLRVKQGDYVDIGYGLPPFNDSMNVGMTDSLVSIGVDMSAKETAEISHIKDYRIVDATKESVYTSLVERLYYSIGVIESTNLSLVDNISNIGLQNREEGNVVVSERLLIDSPFSKPDATNSVKLSIGFGENVRYGYGMPTLNDYIQIRGLERLFFNPVPETITDDAGGVFVQEGLKWDIKYKPFGKEFADTLLSERVKYGPIFKDRLNVKVQAIENVDIIKYMPEDLMTTKPYSHTTIIGTHSDYHDMINYDIDDTRAIALIGDKTLINPTLYFKDTVSVKESEYLNGVKHSEEYIDFVSTFKDETKIKTREKFDIDVIRDDVAEIITDEKWRKDYLRTHIMDSLVIDSLEGIQDVSGRGDVFVNTRDILFYAETVESEGFSKIKTVDKERIATKIVKLDNVTAVPKKDFMKSLISIGPDGKHIRVFLNEFPTKGALGQKASVEDFDNKGDILYGMYRYFFYEHTYLLLQDKTLMSGVINFDKDFGFVNDNLSNINFYTGKREGALNKARTGVSDKNKINVVLKFNDNMGIITKEFITAATQALKPLNEYI